jgi:hypothetical protein
MKITLKKSVLILLKIEDRVRYNTYDSVSIRKEKIWPRNDYCIKFYMIFFFELKST